MPTLMEKDLHLLIFTAAPKYPNLELIKILYIYRKKEKKRKEKKILNNFNLVLI